MQLSGTICLLSSLERTLICKFQPSPKSQTLISCFFLPGRLLISARISLSCDVLRKKTWGTKLGCECLTDCVCSIKGVTDLER